MVTRGRTNIRVFKLPHNETEKGQMGDHFEGNFMQKFNAKNKQFYVRLHVCVCIVYSCDVFSSFANFTVYEEIVSGVCVL